MTHEPSDWRPTASFEALAVRAELLARARQFFARRGVLEVETPMLSPAGSTDPHLHSFVAASRAPGDASAPRFLHTSPEFAMKRLLAAGSGSIYQICRVFRAGETGRRHNPEFTLLEWYRVGFDYHALMDEVEALVTELLRGRRDLDAPERLSYRDAFLRYAGLDPHAATPADLAAAAAAHGLCASGIPETDGGAWRDLLLTHLVEPHLGRNRLTFLYDFPADAAALARVRPGPPPVAERFELYLDGIELANGFQELTDAEEQRERFERDRARRRAHGLPDVPHDERLLAALAAGLPSCSGVALGFDRLVMVALGARSIAEVIAFPADRA
ncbi:MAG TPA: EF-P lysine aminoacylase EpmA [Burkholderiales bacterium]